MFALQKLAIAGLHVVVGATSMLLVPLTSQAGMWAPRAGLVCISIHESKACLLVRQQQSEVRDHRQGCRGLN